MRTRIHWLVLALALILIAAFLYFSSINGTDPYELINTAAFGTLALSGVVIIARQPRNPVGWVVTFLGLSVVFASLLFLLAVYDPPGAAERLPGSDELAFLSFIAWVTVLPSVVIFILLFPNGKLPHPNWRFLPILLAIFTLPALLFTIVTFWRHRGEIVDYEAQTIEIPPDLTLLFRVLDLWNVVLILCLVLGLLSLIHRYRQASGVERQQLKWFVFGLGLIPFSVAFDSLAYAIGDPVMIRVSDILDVLSVLVFPVILVIAITRYHLFDIDFIIRRTLLYSALTLTLGLIYLGSVLLMQNLFTQRFGQQPSIIIVISTLLIAALFQPLRRRFQEIIDRRFYRGKYNAEQTLETFSARLRNEVDLSRISSGLVAAVEENIQPEFAHLWIVNKKEGD